MKPALQIYSTDFDADFFKLPKDVQKRIESAVDRLGANLDAHSHHAMACGNSNMRIALGTDHAGFELKEIIKAHLEAKGIEVIDFGADSKDAVDYPDFVRPAAESVANGAADFGIVFGGSGNGEAIVANKVPGIRCGLCWNKWSARMTKEHNNANVIALGGRVVSPAEASEIVDAWLAAKFEGGRHQRRVEKIEPDSV